MGLQTVANCACCWLPASLYLSSVTLNLLCPPIYCHAFYWFVVYYGGYMDAQNVQKCSRTNSSRTAHSLGSSCLVRILVAVASGACCSALSSFNMHAELCLSMSGMVQIVRPQTRMMEVYMTDAGDQQMKVQLRALDESLAESGRLHKLTELAAIHPGMLFLFAAPARGQQWACIMYAS